jgi:hypothetical protein
LKIKPDKHEALNNWGGTLVMQSDSKDGSMQQQLRRVAREKLLAAEQIHRGAGAYNLACLEAAEGDAVKAAEWLRHAVEAGGKLSRKRIVEDNDFDRIRDDRAFVEFLRTLPE